MSASVTKYLTPEWTATVYGDAIKLRHAAHTCHVTFERKDRPPTKYHEALLAGLEHAYAPDEDDDPYTRVVDVAIESFGDLATLAIIVQRPLSKDDPSDRAGRIVGLKAFVEHEGVEAYVSIGSDRWVGVGVPPCASSAVLTLPGGNAAGAAESLRRVRASLDDAISLIGGGA